MKKKKITSIIMLAIWSVIIIVVLTFGSSVGRKIQKYLSSILIDKKANDIIEISDINIEVNEYYLVGKNYQIKVKPIPYTEVDLGLIYQSLDPNIFTVDSNGVISGVRNSDKETIGSLEITSSKFKNIKKILTLKFKKEYPSDFQFYIVKNDDNLNKDTVFINSPVYLNYDFSNSVPFSEDECFVDYDKKMLKKINDNKFIPLKTGKTTIRCSTSNNIVREIDLNIIENPTLNYNIDDIKILNNKNEMYNKNDGYFNVFIDEISNIKLYNKQNQIFTNYEIKSSDNSILTINNFDELVYKKAGKVVISIIVNDQIIGKIPINIKAHISIPSISGINIDNDLIILDNEIPKQIYYNFSSNEKGLITKLLFDEQFIDLESKINNCYHIVPKKVGKTYLKVIVTDGIETIEKDYNIVIQKNRNSSKEITNKVTIFVSKFIGHWYLFLIEAVLAFWMLKNLNIKKEIINIIIFISIGLSIASITELIQYFIPGRNGCIEDVIFDLIPYILTACICQFVNFIIKKKKMRKV